MRHREREAAVDSEEGRVRCLLDVHEPKEDRVLGGHRVAREWLEETGLLEQTLLLQLGRGSGSSEHAEGDVAGYV